MNQLPEESIVTPRAIQYTSTGVLWMKIVSYFLLVIMGIYGLYFVYQTIQNIRLYWQFQEQFGDLPGVYAPLFWVGIVLQFGILAVIIYILSLLLRAANRFNDFVENKQKSSLEAAFASSRRYWLTLAIFLSTLLVLVVVVVVVAVISISNAQLPLAR